MFNRSNSNYLTVFQKNSYQIHPQFLLQKEPRNIIGSFRSFFAFLKPKPFIRSSTFILLSSLHLNPKPYSLNQVITQTKTFSANQLNTFFQSNKRNNAILSSQLLLWLVSSSLQTTKNSLNFNLFKHKIYNYTTGKKIIRLFTVTKISQPIWLDFRTASSSYRQITSVPNVSTISTYNWKSIN